MEHVYVSCHDEASFLDEQKVLSLLDQLHFSLSGNISSIGPGDGELPLPVLDRLVTPLLPTRSRLLIRRPSPLAFRPRYVVLICDTHIVCV